MNVTLNLDGFTYTSDAFTGGGLAGDDLFLTFTGPQAPAFRFRQLGNSPSLLAPGDGGSYLPALLNVNQGMHYTIKGGVLVQTTQTNVDGDIGFIGISGLSVREPFSKLESDLLTIGYRAGLVASLSISEQATVQTNLFAILAGEVGDATGMAFVEGGAVWDIRGELTVGDTGNGTIFVWNGGIVTSPSVIIGNQAGSIGNVRVNQLSENESTSFRGYESTVVGHEGAGTLILEGKSFGSAESLVAGDCPVPQETSHLYLEAYSPHVMLC